MSPFRPRSGSLPTDAAMEPLRHQDLPSEATPYTDSYAQPPTYMSRVLPQRFMQPMVSRDMPPSRLYGFLQFLAIPMSVAVVGILALGIEFYQSSRNDRYLIKGNLTKHAWPIHGAAMTPTYILLGGAGLALLLSLFNLLACCGPLKKAISKRAGAGVLTVVLSLVSAVLIVGVVSFKTWDERTSLYGWSCANRHAEIQVDNNEVGLGSVCNTLFASWIVGIATAALEVICLIIISVSLFRPRASASQRMANRVYRKVDDTEYHGAPEGTDDTYPMIQRPRST